jgi:secreted trypsin-like serine protease
VFQGTARLTPERILVQIGRYQLSIAHKDSEEHEVGQIVMHEEYEHFTYLNDIAVLILATEVSFNNFIQPACLWDESDDADSAGLLGTVIGWGTTEKDDLSDVLAQGTMPVVSKEVCMTSNRDYEDFLTDDMICAGYRNGTAVCNGDSGGGMFFRYLLSGSIPFKYLCLTPRCFQS